MRNVIFGYINLDIITAYPNLNKAFDPDLLSLYNTDPNAGTDLTMSENRKKTIEGLKKA